MPHHSEFPLLTGNVSEFPHKASLTVVLPIERCKLFPNLDRPQNAERHTGRALPQEFHIRVAIVLRSDAARNVKAHVQESGGSKEEHVSVFHARPNDAEVSPSRASTSAGPTRFQHFAVPSYGSSG